MSGPRYEPPTAPSARRAIYFDGSGLYFSETLLAAIAREFAELSVFCTRDSDYRHHPEIQLVLVAPDRMTEFGTVVTELMSVIPSARLVFCYEHEDQARAMFAEHRTRIVEQDISLMPTNVRLDTWMSYIRLFLQGQTLIATSLIGAVEDCGRATRSRSSSPALQKLTAREAEILALAAQGEQNKLIASQLKISEHTVKLHMHRVIRKLGVRNRTEAAHFLMRSAS
ncbi:DNA-binding response regulator, NarL/FixJ family, contains REC and HTH domains [Palleronia marisminoris]|uniref:Transcriptional regulatory protein LiaR n=2 Tax=Palleronia marisminoris TaxID=315423 RepID=A0A1Y5R7S4_9RHOB|nr:DNA-binding response regulator, NarL/FixJ family, contains REC and HTH domains [Palleronia marisminoris]SLN11141.1 Transcriptional regulatory protein LiaR [Palleronia marisminoris]